MYKNHLAPFLTNHEGDIEQWLDAGSAKVLSILNITLQTISNILKGELGGYFTASQVPQSSEALHAGAAEDEPPSYDDVVERAAPPLRWLANAAHMTSSAAHYLSHDASETRQRT